MPKNCDFLTRLQELNMLKLLISLALLTSFPIHADQSVNWLRQYLTIDTVNPPGNESRGVAFLANILEEADIPFETAESASNRGNIWARLKGGDEPALILCTTFTLFQLMPNTGMCYRYPAKSRTIIFMAVELLTLRAWGSLNSLRFLP